MARFYMAVGKGAGVRFLDASLRRAHPRPVADLGEAVLYERNGWFCGICAGALSFGVSSCSADLAVSRVLEAQPSSPSNRPEYLWTLEGRPEPKRFFDSSLKEIAAEEVHTVPFAGMVARVFRWPSRFCCVQKSLSIIFTQSRPFPDDASAIREFTADMRGFIWLVVHLLGERDSGFVRRLRCAECVSRYGLRLEACAHCNEEPEEPDVRVPGPRRLWLR